MPGYKKDTFGKKAARLRAAVAASTATAAKIASTHDRIGRQRRRKWDIDSGFVDPSLPGTSMQQLALNTRNKASHWDQDSSLRGRPVVFVSGGVVEPLIELELSGNPAPRKLTTNMAPSKEANHLQGSSGGPLQAVLPQPVPLAEETVEDDASTPQGTINNDPDSSDEVILFKGRDGLKDNQPNVPIEVKPESILAITRICSTTPLINPPSPPGLGRLDLLIADSDDEGGSDAAVEDYITNMSSNDMADMIEQLAANRRDLGGIHNDIVIDTSSNGGGGDGVEHETSPTSDGDNDQSDAKQEGERDDGSESDDSDDTSQFAADVDDEQLARLLAKQEALGLGAEEPVLFDANPNPKRTTTRQGRLNEQPKHSKGSAPWNSKVPAGYDFKKGIKASDGSYPSAEAVAKAFEQLEVTGWANGGDRFQLELSDSELETTLKASWQKDRIRKKEKKKAREELRAQGLLRKNANPNDPRIKYPNGMSLDDMKAEFKLFLLSSENSVTLAPMDAHGRKIVHEIAYRFNITSKSTGSGDQRRPTLVRTKSTVRLNEDLFENVFAKYRRRFFARLNGNKSLNGGSKTLGGRKGGDPGAASVRNGEIVGGSAPEISLANKGRTMLEKMGWSTGMALGALNNKGMTQPIEHIVKRSKAGLG